MYRLLYILAVAFYCVWNKNPQVLFTTIITLAPIIVIGTYCIFSIVKANDLMSFCWIMIHFLSWQDMTGHDKYTT